MYNGNIGGVGGINFNPKNLPHELGHLATSTGMPPILSFKDKGSGQPDIDPEVYLQNVLSNIENGSMTGSVQFGEKDPDTGINTSPVYNVAVKDDKVILTPFKNGQQGTPIEMTKEKFIEKCMLENGIVNTVRNNPIESSEQTDTTDIDSSLDNLNESISGAEDNIDMGLYFLKYKDIVKKEGKYNHLSEYQVISVLDSFIELAQKSNLKIEKYNEKHDGTKVYNNAEELFNDYKSIGLNEDGTYNLHKILLGITKDVFNFDHRISID